MKGGVSTGVSFLMNQTALIIEDHPMFRDALLGIMCGVFGVANVIAVSSVEKGLTSFNTVDGPTLISLDLGLPGMEGVEAVRSLRRKFAAAMIVIVSASDDRHMANAALNAGATAFMSKALSSDAMSEVLRKMRAGEALESNWITPHRGRAVNKDGATPLTARQSDTLACLCTGMSNKEIGIRLGLSEITVKMHIGAIFQKLGVANRTQAVLAARSTGLAQTYTGD